MPENLNNDLAELSNRFFGKISASATHEIKNAISIINENAGLLEDLYLASKKKDISPDRIHTVSQSIIKQVKRTDRIVNNLNRFSHSMDKNSQQIDLGETIGFILELSSRLTQMKGILIQIESPKTPVLLTSSLFYFQNMIWKSIETACEMVSDKKHIIISLKTLPDKILINFSFDTADKKINIPVFCSKEDKILMEYLGVCVENNIKTNGFSLLWPPMI